MGDQAEHELGSSRRDDFAQLFSATLDRAVDPDPLAQSFPAVSRVDVLAESSPRPSDENSKADFLERRITV